MAILALNSPERQNIITGFCLFFAVGIYTAVLNLGAGGQQADAVHVNNIVSGCLYGLFGVVGFFAGSILNKLGPRYTMMLGAFGYPFYISGLWYFDKRGSSVYAIVGGCVLGACAALLWTVSNYVAFAYAAEHQKGRFYATQAVLDTCGIIVAAIVVFGITHTNAAPDGVPTAVYATFFCLMAMSIVAGSFLCRTEDVRRREDGKPLAVFKSLSFWEEVKGCVSLLKDVKPWLLLPALLFAENPLILQPTISAYWFDLRTRSLVVLVSAVFQLFAFIGYQAVLDWESLPRRTRAFIGLGILTTVYATAYSGEVGWASTLPHEVFTVDNGVDWSDGGRFGGFFVIYILFQIAAAIGPMYLCWTISTFTNEPKRVAYWAGFMRSAMACGTASFFGVAAGGVPVRTQITVHFACQMGGLVPVAVLVYRYVTNTNYLAEKGIVFIPAHEAEILKLGVVEGSETDSSVVPVEYEANTFAKQEAV